MKKTNKEIEARLNALKDEQVKLESVLFPLRDDIHALRLELAIRKAGDIRTGDTIEWDYGKNKSRRGKVIKIKLGHWDQVVYVVQNLRKDGSVGSTSKIYHWDNPRKV
jgi:hypothetical protein